MPQQAWKGSPCCHCSERLSSFPQGPAPGGSQQLSWPPPAPSPLSAPVAGICFIGASPEGQLACVTGLFPAYLAGFK